MLRRSDVLHRGFSHTDRGLMKPLRVLSSSQNSNTAGLYIATDETFAPRWTAPNP